MTVCIVKIHPSHLHNTLSNENVKWYFCDTSYNAGPIVCCHPQQLCLLSRREFASPQSTHSSNCICSFSISSMYLYFCPFCTWSLCVTTFAVCFFVIICTLYTILQTFFFPSVLSRSLTSSFGVISCASTALIVLLLCSYSCLLLFLIYTMSCNLFLMSFATLFTTTVLDTMMVFCPFHQS